MRNCVAFLFAYQKQQTLEQRVDTRGSDNPAMYYFTCHLQVICSSHTVHSGQHCYNSTSTLPGASHSKSAIKENTELDLSLLLWCPSACFNFELNAYTSTFYLPFIKMNLLGICM